MKQLYLLTLLLAFGVMYGSKSLQELKVGLENTTSKEAEIHTVINIAYAFSRTLPDSGLAYGRRGLQEAIQHNLKHEEARANAAIGINYLVKSQYRLALEFQFKALKQYEEMDSLKHAAGANANICLIFMNQSDYKQAMQYALKALSAYEDIGEEHNKAIVLENIGTLFFRQDNYDKAQEYYQKSYAIYQKEGDSTSIARNKSNTGMVLSKTGKYKEAEAAHMLALFINKKKNNQRSIQINYGNIGLLEHRKGNYEKALLYYDSAQTLAKNIGVELDYMANLGNIGETYVKMATLQKGKPGEELLNKGMKYLQDGINGCLALASVDPAIGFYETLAEAYVLKGDYKSALQTSKEGEQLKDSVHSVANRISLENMEALHSLSSLSRDLKLKNQELHIKNLELNESKHKVMLYVMGLIIVILAGIVVAYLLCKYIKRNKLLAKSNEMYAGKIEEQLASLKKHATVLDEITYMQAHHVREPVATILGMVEHFNYDNLSDPMNLFIVENLDRVARQLDVAVREVINKKEEVKEV